MYQLVAEVVEEEELPQVVVEVVQVSSLDAARLLLSFVQSLLANGGYNFVHMLYCPCYMGICTCKKQHCSCCMSLVSNIRYTLHCSADLNIVSLWFNHMLLCGWLRGSGSYCSMRVCHTVPCLHLQSVTRHSACCQECVIYPLGCICELLVGMPVRRNLFAGGAAAEKEEEKKDEPEEESDEVGAICISSLVLEQ